MQLEAKIEKKIYAANHNLKDLPHLGKVWEDDA